MIRLWLLPLAFSISVFFAACGSNGAAPQASPAAEVAEGNVEIIGSFPHADSAWTEGLLVSDGDLWESTGLNGKSTVRGLDKQTGEVLWSIPNPDGFFNEGLVRAFGKTYLLTYKEGTAYLFDRNAARPYSWFAGYDGEGWGLTATLSSLVNSNGTAMLFYRDPVTFEVTKEVSIRFDGELVNQLNELEYDGTYIWANQWMTHYIYRIREDDPAQIVRYTLPDDLCREGNPNGIAWDAEEGVFYLTGQQCNDIWRARFE